MRRLHSVWNGQLEDVKDVMLWSFTYSAACHCLDALNRHCGRGCSDCRAK
jgi:hypothetical protein